MVFPHWWSCNMNPLRFGSLSTRFISVRVNSSPRFVALNATTVWWLRDCWVVCSRHSKSSPEGKTSGCRNQETTWNKIDVDTLDCALYAGWGSGALDWAASTLHLILTSCEEQSLRQVNLENPQIAPGWGIPTVGDRWLFSTMFYLPPRGYNENHAKGLLFISFRRFWVKEPRRSETIFAKKRYTLYLYRSTRISFVFCPPYGIFVHHLDIIGHGIFSSGLHFWNISFRTKIQCFRWGYRVGYQVSNLACRE